MSRSLLRSVARWLVGVVLFGQVAIAAYGCPGVTPLTSAEQSNAADAQAAASPNMSFDCDDPTGASDQAFPNLCAEHCKVGQQSDHAPVVFVPVGSPVEIYENRLPPPVQPRRRPAASLLSALVAATPPHAILHCVLRT